MTKKISTYTNRLLLIIALSFVMSWRVAAGVAAPLVLNASTVDLNFSDLATLYKADDEQFPANFDDITRWQASKQVLSAREISINGGQYWFVLKIDNQSQYSDLVLRPYNTLIEKMHFSIYSRSGVQQVFSGENYPTQYDFHYGNNVTLNKGETHYLVGYIESSYFYLSLNVRLTPVEKFKAQVTLENLLVVLCLGIGLALGLYNLLIYFAFKDKCHLYYALFTGSWFFYWTHFHLVFPKIVGNSYPHLHWLGVASMLVFGIFFYSHFLKLEELHPKLNRISINLARFIICCIPLVMAKPGIGFLLLTVVSSIYVLLAFYAGIYCWRIGFRPAKYFVLAYWAVSVPNMINNLIEFNLLPSIDVNGYLLGLIGFSLESILLAFALANKFSLINEENIELNKSLEDKVSIRTTELAETNLKLKKASEAKSEFLAKMSHEIRTPMNAVIGLSRLTLKSKLDHDQKNNVENILESGEGLLVLINDILDFSKIEAGKLTLEKNSFQLEKLIRRSINVSALKAQVKGLELIVDVDNRIPAVLMGDSHRLQQVIVNLIGNAVKFTETGTICIKLQLKQEMDRQLILQVSVIDTGIGMTAQQQSRLFKSFSQADDSVTRRYGGTGLGLAISKQLSELMGGEIWLESEAGKGTSFHFTALLDKTDTQPALLIDRNKVSGLKVLIVDDIAMARTILQTLLNNIGIKAGEAQTGREAIDLIKRAESEGSYYDIVFMDWRMPHMDGIEAARYISELGIKKSPHILMVSAYDKDKAKTLINGTAIDGFIEKPIDQSVLVDSILNVLSSDIVAFSSEQATELAPPNLAAFHILLVEDNAINRQVVLGFLKDTHIQVDIAENGLIALEKLRQATYDLVFMDIQMPEMDGITATKEIRQTLKLLSLPVVAMTAHAMVDDVNKSLEAGMDSHITKPIDPNTLYRTLATFLNVTSEENDPAVFSVNSPEPILSDISQPVQDQLALINQIDAIDCDLALSQLKGNVELYLFLIKDFVSEQCTSQELERLYRKADWEVLHRIIHSLKSNTTYIGAFYLSKLCHDLENSLLKGQPEQALFDNISVALDRLLEALSSIYDVAPAGMIVPFSIERLIHELNKIRPLLQASDFSVEQYFPKIEALCIDSEYSPYIKKIIAHVDDIEYEEAALHAERLYTKLQATNT
ncbi:MAG: response regulator [Colwellia sp.]|jgi:Signal transduction histidine kinase